MLQENSKNSRKNTAAISRNADDQLEQMFHIFQDEINAVVREAVSLKQEARVVLEQVAQEKIRKQILDIKHNGAEL